jgi:hypothetical protein
MAGRQGFEPWAEIYSPSNRLAGGPNRPLWHLPGRVNFTIIKEQVQFSQQILGSISPESRSTTRLLPSVVLISTRPAGSAFTVARLMHSLQDNLGVFLGGKGYQLTFIRYI